MVIASFILCVKSCLGFRHFPQELLLGIFYLLLRPLGSRLLICRGTTDTKHLFETRRVFIFRHLVLKSHLCILERFLLLAILFESDVALVHPLELFFELLYSRIALLIIHHHRLALLHEAHPAAVFTDRETFYIAGWWTFTLLVNVATVAEIAPLELGEFLDECLVPLQIGFERRVLYTTLVRASLLVHSEVFQLLLLLLNEQVAEGFVKGGVDRLAQEDLLRLDLRLEIILFVQQGFPVIEQLLRPQVKDQSDDQGQSDNQMRHLLRRVYYIVRALAIRDESGDKQHCYERLEKELDRVVLLRGAD